MSANASQGQRELKRIDNNITFKWYKNTRACQWGLPSALPRKEEKKIAVKHNN